MSERIPTNLRNIHNTDRCKRICPHSHELRKLGSAKLDNEVNELEDPVIESGEGDVFCFGPKLFGENFRFGIVCRANLYVRVLDQFEEEVDAFDVRNFLHPRDDSEEAA